VGIRNTVPLYGTCAPELDSPRRVMDESAKSRGRQATLYQWGAPQSEPMVVTRGSGAVVFDDQGNAYVDCTSQAWSLNVGYGHPAVLEAARQQLERLTHVRTA